ncbi:MAG: hypothetical protein AB2735_10775, partial [Candidatus Thiodiazotropha taylori]
PQHLNRAIETGVHTHMDIACFNGAIEMLWAGSDWCLHGDETEILEAVTAFMMAGVIGQR